MTAPAGVLLCCPHTGNYTSAGTWWVNCSEIKVSIPSQGGSPHRPCTELPAPWDLPGSPLSQFIFVALWGLVATAFGTGWGDEEQERRRWRNHLAVWGEEPGGRRDPSARGSQPWFIGLVLTPSWGLQNPRGSLATSLPRSLGGDEVWGLSRSGGGEEKGQGGLQPSLRPGVLLCPQFPQLHQGKDGDAFAQQPPS